MFFAKPAFTGLPYQIMLTVIYFWLRDLQLISPSTLVAKVRHTELLESDSVWRSQLLQEVFISLRCNNITVIRHPTFLAVFVVLLSFEILILLWKYHQTVAMWMQLWLLGQFVSLTFKWGKAFYDYRLCCVFKASTFVILGLPLPLCKNWTEHCNLNSVQVLFELLWCCLL